MDPDLVRQTGAEVASHQWPAILYVMLPAYNEEESLPQLLADLERTLGNATGAWRIVVVDDGSQDRTVAVCRDWERRLPLKVIAHGQNCGLGAAMLTGLRAVAVMGGESDVVITMDADNTHPPVIIFAMLAELADGAEVVIASRFVRGASIAGLAWPRRLLSAGASALLRWFFPIPGVRDYSCGYRAYRVGLLKRAFELLGDELITQVSFVCQAELLVRLAQLSPRFAEVALQLRYDLKAGRSKMKLGSTLRGYCWLVRNRRLLRSAAGLKRRLSSGNG